MRIRDVRDADEIFRPGNLQKEVERVRDMALDLVAFHRIEIALPDRENLRFFRLQEEPALAFHVGIVARGQLLQILKLPFGQDCGLVRLRDEGEILLEPPDLFLRFMIDAPRKLFVTVASVL